MPIQKQLHFAFALFLFGTSTVYGQQSDPFAEWDLKNPRTSTVKSKPASRSAKSTVEWFSPNADNESPSESSKPQVPMREQTAKSATTPTKSVSTAPGSTKAVSSKALAEPQKKTSEKTANATTVTAKTVTEMPEQQSPPLAPQLSKSPPTRKPAGKPAATTAGEQGKDSASGIRQAGFAPLQHSGKGTVRQISGQSDENPFEEFLRSTAPEKDSDVVRTPATFSGSEDDMAEPLVIRKPKSDPTAAPRNPVVRKSTNPLAKTVSATTHDAVFAPERPTHDVQAGPQSPGVTVEWKRHGAMNVGQECELELIVQNTSRASVQSVMTEAVIPAGLEIIETTPAAMEGADAPTWTFGEMKPGESRSVRLTVVPQQRGDLRMDAFVRLTGYSSSAFTVEEPLIGVAISGPETAEIGEQVGYVVRVSNPGTGVASNVVIQAAIPEGLEHRSGSLPSIEIGTLNPGESRQARLNLSTVKGGEYDLAVRVVADGGLSDETKTSVSVAEPELSIEIAGSESQLAGREAEFTLTISNEGNVQSSNVRAKYRIPEGCEFVSANRGGKYADADHSIEWFVGTLQPDESSEFSLTLKAKTTGEMFHQAGVKSELGQAKMCSFASIAEGTAALELKLVASDRQVMKGDEVVWEVRIKNSGSRAAENVGISCELPTGIQVIGADGPSEHIAENGIMIFRSLPTIDAGEDVVYKITTRAVREGNQRLRLRVASQSISEALIGEESATVSGR